MWTKPRLPEIKLQQDTGVVLSGKTSHAGVGVESPHGHDDLTTATTTVTTKLACPALGTSVPLTHGTDGMNMLNKSSFLVVQSPNLVPIHWHRNKRITKEKKFSLTLFLFCWSTGNGDGEIWTQMWTSSWNIINYSHRKSTRTIGLQTLEPFTPLT